MDWKELDTMLERYYEGESTLDEERAIKLFFNSVENVPDKYREAAELFGYFNREASITMPDNFKFSAPVNKHKLWSIIGSTGIAASIAIFIAITINHNQPKAIDQIAQITYQEQKKAYYQTKEALLIVSDNLKKGKREIQRLSIFNEVQKTIIKN